ncbi:MAG: serine/threonine protein kinase [Thermoplasmatota archaeon]
MMIEGMTQTFDPSLRWDEEIRGVSTLTISLPKKVEFHPVNDGRSVEFTSPKSGRKAVYSKEVGYILEGLNAGHQMPDIADRVADLMPETSRKQSKRFVRGFVRVLAESGIVDITLPAVPERFQNRFRRERLLGYGGVGVAWLCRDEATPGEPSVVVKHAWNFVSSFGASEKLVVAEAEVLPELDHPAIPKLLSTFAVDGRFHFVRGYVEGKGLGHAREIGLKSVARRKEVGATIVEILEHVHARGFLFLDVAPSNFLWSPDGRLQVIDVGLAKRIPDGGVVEKLPMGTRGFAAPETTFKRIATKRSDVYGLGRVYVFMTTGSHNPSRQEPPESVAKRMRAAGADENEIAFVTACCEVEPAKRPATPADAAKLLLAS